MSRTDAPSKLVLFKETDASPPSSPAEEALDFQELKRRIRSAPLGHAFRYRDVTLRTGDIDLLSKPLLSAVMIRLLSRGGCAMEDKRGNRRAVGPSLILKHAVTALRDRIAAPGLLASIGRELDGLSAAPPRARGGAPDASGFPVYLRTDVSHGIKSGGSVGHIAGVLNNLDAFFAKPRFFTTDVIPTVREDIPAVYIKPTSRFADYRELPSLYFNFSFHEGVLKSLAGRPPAFIYQRYSLNNFTGAKLARQLGVPFVLEYNGSEVWIARNWGMPLRYEALSERIELLDMAVADLIVVVSQPMKDELIERGIAAEKILVNPNGVDADRYSPSVDGSAVRRRHGLEGRTVIGFIGTFGRWHGAEVLADAFGRLVKARPDLAGEARLLMIGDGQMMPQVKEAIARHGIGPLCVLTGLVPQKEGPAYLAACDLLASPHVPNADGTPFFGSPTKLFEYMAMGKGIVASDLDQIGEVLSHDSTAWMVEPGDADGLADGLRRLVEDKALRERLGAGARREAVAKHTWREHTRKIVERLGELCS